jgi:hypothetical protein
LVTLLRLQSDEVSVTKAAKELRKLFDGVGDDKHARKNFFQNLVFLLQVPLVNGTRFGNYPIIRNYLLQYIH